MEKIKVLIVEDELLVAEDLKEKLEANGFEVFEIVDTGESALELIPTKIPDLIIMDIHLKGKLDGIQTATKLKNINLDIPIIYLSDHIDEKTVNRAKKTHPANYLSKPFKLNDVLRALEIAFFNTAKSTLNKSKSRLSDRIFIRVDRQTSEMILYSDILYLEAERSYSAIITEDKKFLLSSNMSKVMDQFQHPDFVRVHRSYIINIQRITGIEGNTIRLGSNHEVQMSDNYRSEVLRIVNIIK